MDEKWVRYSVVAVVLAVALIAGVVSYQHLETLALTHGQPLMAARLLPLSVDGLITSAGLVLFSAARRRVPRPHLAMWMLGAGIIGTIAGNVSYGWSYGLIGALVSAWPALSFAGSVEMLLALIRSSRPVEEITGGPMPDVHQLFASFIASKTVPSIREIKKIAMCSQDRAMRVQKYLEFVVES